MPSGASTHAPLAQHLLFPVCLPAAVLNQSAECLFRGFHCAAVFRGQPVDYRLVLFFQWQYAHSQPDLLANFVTTQYLTTVRSRMLIVPVATTLTVFIALER